MKRRIVCLLIFIFLLTACTNENPEMNANSNAEGNATAESIQNTESVTSAEPAPTEPTPIPTTTKEPTILEPNELPEVTQEEIAAAWDARLTVDREYNEELPNVLLTGTENIFDFPEKDGIDQFFYAQRGYIEITGDNYRLLSESVANIMDTEKDILFDRMEALDLDEFYESHFSCFWGVDKITRVDNRILSFVMMNTMADKEIEGYTLDVLTGKKLELSDVIADEERFWIYTKEFIITSIQEDPSIEYNENYEDIVNAMSENRVDWYWYFNASGMVIEFQEKVIRRYSPEFTIPYKECAHLFYPQYLPGDSAMCGEVSGNAETVLSNTTSFVINCEASENTYWDSPVLNLNDYSEKIEAREIYENYDFNDLSYAYTVRRYDGKEYLIIEVRAIWDIATFRIYEITGGEVRLCNDIKELFIEQNYYDNVITFNNGIIAFGIEYRWDSTEEW